MYQNKLSLNLYKFPKTTQKNKGLEIKIYNAILKIVCSVNEMEIANMYEHELLVQILLCLITFIEVCIQYLAYVLTIIIAINPLLNLCSVKIGSKLVN